MMIAEQKAENRKGLMANLRKVNKPKKEIKKAEMSGESNDEGHEEEESVREAPRRSRPRNDEELERQNAEIRELNRIISQRNANAARIADNMECLAYLTDEEKAFFKKESEELKNLDPDTLKEDKITQRLEDLESKVFKVLVAKDHKIGELETIIRGKEVEIERLREAPSTLKVKLEAFERYDKVYQDTQSILAEINRKIASITEGEGGMEENAKYGVASIDSRLFKRRLLCYPRSTRPRSKVLKSCSNA